VTYPPHSTPGSPGDSWTTPEQSFVSPVVTPVHVEHAAVPGGQAVAMAGDPGAMGDDIAASVAQSTANAEARYSAHERLTHPQGSALGVPLTMPGIPSDYGKNTAGSNATDYDPAG
jgi:hypothetical protein